DSIVSYIGLLNRLWNGTPFEPRRRTTKSVTIKGRRFTVALMMQPVVLRRMLAAGQGASREMGLIARYCVAWPTSTIGFRPYRAPTAGTPAMQALHRRMTELLNLPLPTSGPDMVLVPRSENCPVRRLPCGAIITTRSKPSLAAGASLGRSPTLGQR